MRIVPPIEPLPTPWQLEAPPDDHPDDALGGRRRPRAGDAPRRLPARPLPDAARDAARLVVAGRRRASSRSTPSRRHARSAARGGGYEIRVDTAFADVVVGCAGPASPTAGSTPTIVARVHAAARARLGALRRGVGRRGPRGRALRRRDRRALRGRVDVPRAHRRVEGSATSVSSSRCARPATPDRRLLDVQWLTPHLASTRRGRGVARARVPRAASRTRVALADAFA